jgi:ubiquinone biosynthesis protein UbiJ
MFSFLVGLATGSALVLNGPKVRRSLAKAVLTGGNAAAAASKHVQRISTRVLEDFQDAFAEAHADAAQKSMERQAAAGLHDEIRKMRADLSSLRPQSGTGSVQ